MTEESAGFPDLGEHDWTAMEQLANGADAESVDGSPHGIVITPEMLIKRVLWDVAPHKMVADVSDYLGLTKSSEEGVEMEHREVHERMAQSLALAPYVYTLASHAARAIFATMVLMEDDVDEVPLDGEIFEESVSKFEAVIFAASLSTVSEMLDWGLIHTPHFIMAGPDDDVEELIRKAQGEDSSGE